MNIFFKKYPRLCLFAVSLIVGIIIFYEFKHCEFFHNLLLSLGYFGTFFAGIFYAYGFTAAPASAVLLSVGKEQSLLYAFIAGSIGALFGDLIIYFFVKNLFMHEIKALSRISFFKWIGSLFSSNAYKLLIYICSGILIASPLPTEIGIVLLSSQRLVSLHKFIFFILLFHSIGIFSMLWIGTRL